MSNRTLVTMKDMLVKARAEKYAVGAFEFWSLDSAFAVAETANEMGSDIILQVGWYERDYMGGYPNARKLAEMAAQVSGRGVALHLDHAESYDEVMRALDGGFTSVMIDGSALPLAENIKLARRVVEAARKYGASTEAELGRLAGAEGTIENAEEFQTDPAEAARFVEETGIDSLAVAIGTAHGFYKSVPKINIARLKEIAARVKIPLVLHGGSGTPVDKVAEAIANGVAKVNICTEFIAAYGKGYVDAQAADFKCNVPGLFGKGQERAKALVRSKLQLFLGKNHG